MAVAVRIGLDPWLGQEVPYITLFGAVIVAAWYGGVATGLFAAVLGYLAAFILLTPPSLAATLAYAFSTLLIAGLGGAMHRATRRAETSEERFRKFMENSPACVFMKDEDGRYVFMNAAAERLIGTSAWEGKTDHELLPAAAAREIRAHDVEMLQAGAPAAFSLAIARPEGTRHFHSTKFPLRDAEGRRLVGSVTVDVTEQMRTLEELRVQRGQLRLVTDTMSTGVVRVSAKLTYLWVNRVFAEWAGRTPEDMVGRPIVEVIGEDGLEALQPYIQRLWKGERVEYERVARFPRLGERWIHSVAEPTFDEAGVPNGWVAVVSDIQERKLGAAALENAREQLQLVADSMPAAVAHCSRDLSYIWVNRRAAEWLGTTPEAVAGRPMVEVIGEKNLAAIRPYIERVLRGEQVQYERLVNYQGMGGQRWVRNHFSPVRGGQSWLTVIIDVHEQKLMEEALLEADRRKDAFLATLAHELRNPLAPIRNAVALLARKELDGELAWSREVLERQVAQLSRLIDDLLDIARIASGKLLVKKERIPLERAIDMALETSRPHIIAAGHRLSVLLPAERVTVEADLTRLAQVFANLLNNAARYTEGQGEISLTAEVQRREVVVCVQDSGVGFTDEDGARLFEPFAQLSGPLERAQGGLGIGLSIVRGIVLLHGGSVEARSRGPGKGAEFIVRLPLPAFSPAAEPAAPQKAPAQANGSGLRVMVADDNRDAADSLQRVLALYGYDVRVAYDGAAALSLAEGFAPRVAVLDLGMPGMDGFALARALREKQRGAELTLVALTGWGQDGDRRRALEAGFDRHFTKPVDPAALHELISELTEGKVVNSGSGS